MKQPFILSCGGAVLRRLFPRCCAAACAIFATSLFAQSSGTGTVTGVVTNKATGDLLAGATLEVEGTSITGATERGGGFSLSVPAGTHTLIVNYSGLDAARLPITVTAGQTTTRTVELTSSVYQMEAFSVSGVREGSALAIQAQRLSDNPKWVVATDTFGNPAANPGELIQRLPGIATDVVGSEVRTLYVRGMGPGFSSLMVDGEPIATSTGTSASRDYQIEQLGTGNLESVELVKAPKPSDDANAIAGIVNLVSRRAFDLPGRRITVTGGVLWRDRGLDGSPFRDRADDLDLFSVSYSDVFGVFGGVKNLGISANFNRRVSATTQDEMGPGGVLYNFGQTYLNPNSDNPLTRLFGTGDFGYKAEAHNVGLSVDYKFNPDAFVYFRFQFNTNDQYQVYYRPGVGSPSANAAAFAPGSTYEYSELLPIASSISIVESTPAFFKFSKNFKLSGGGETKLFDGSTKLELNGSYSRANISYPGWIRAQARTPGGVGFVIDRRGQDEWYPIFHQTTGPSIYDPASYLMTSYQKQSYRAPNELYTLRADLTKNFATAVPATLKVGAKYVDAVRKPRTHVGYYSWVGADGVPASGDDALTPYVAYHFNQGEARYGPFPFMTNPEDLPQNYWTQTAADAYNSYANSVNSRQQFQETIGAAYIQGTVKLGRLRVLGGVRVEDTETKGTAWVRNTTASWGGNNTGGTSRDPAVIAANVERAERSFVRRNTATGQYRDVFPGMHFVYEPISSLQVRASYNRSISRPPVPNLIPTLTEDMDSTTITMGNPGLKPYQSDNFEVSVEKYFEPVGQFSVGVFLKEITDYFRNFGTTVGPEGIDGSGQYAGYTLNQVRNIGDARVRGFEMSYQQQFSFLPGVLRGLGAFANYTYLQAEGDFGTLETTDQLNNLAPRSGNAGINFRWRGLDARFLANWTAEKYKSTVSGIDVYNDERLMLDVKLQYTFNRRYDIFLDVTNITDEAPRTDVSLNGLHFFKTNQGVGFVAGLRMRL